MLFVFILLLIGFVNAGLRYGQLNSSSIKSDFCDVTKQESGYFHIKKSKSKSYFYWFSESRSDPDKDPFIIWLTGGPGCSSILALLVENGPCMVNDDLSLKTNPYSWTSKANVIWIDQPAGVGFSYGDVSEYDSTEKEVGEDMYQFLLSFFEKFSKYKKNDFYVFGESYGGHYVPAVANRVFVANKELDNFKINLKGIGIGNGLTNPEVQYPYYPEMAFHNQYDIQAISQKTYDLQKIASPVCVEMIRKCQRYKVACVAAEMFCNAALVAPYQLSGLNVYDIREKCEHLPMCYDFSNVEKFLQLQSTKDALHVSKESSAWKPCNMIVHAKFTYDWMKNFNGLVSPLVEGGVKVLVYAGDADFIVNWMGCKAWTLELEWSQKQAFQNLKDTDWKVDGKTAGKIRSLAGLTFIQVFNAGHMVRPYL